MVLVERCFLVVVLDVDPMISTPVALGAALFDVNPSSS